MLPFKRTLTVNAITMKGANTSLFRSTWNPVAYSHIKTLLTKDKKIYKKWSLGADRLIAAGAYPWFDKIEWIKINEGSCACTYLPVNRETFLSYSNCSCLPLSNSNVAGKSTSNGNHWSVEVPSDKGMIKGLISELSGLK